MKVYCYKLKKYPYNRYEFLGTYIDIRGSMCPQQNSLHALLSALEHRELDSRPPGVSVPFGGAIQHVPYLRIAGQARFWEADPSSESGYENRLEDVITGLHGQNTSFGYLVLGSSQQIELYMGLKGDEGGEMLRSGLHGTFPGIQLAEKPDTSLATRGQALGVFQWVGLLTGIPTRKAGLQARAGGTGDSQQMGRARERGRVQQIERLLRALMGETWGFLVWAAPVSYQNTVVQVQNRLQELTATSMQIHSQENYQKTVSTKINDLQQASEATTRTSDHTDRTAQHVLDLLERDLERLQLGKAQGMWNTGVYFFASRMDVLHKVNALVRSTFAGEDSTPQPVRTFTGKNELFSGQPEPALTLLTSGEVATLCQLPREEFPGYRLTDYASFDLDPLPPAQDAVALGQVLDGGQPTGSWFSIARRDFAKHGLVAGVTGSGKTNTMFSLLTHLWKDGKGVPFLVIEPAKAEYRDLARRNEFRDHLRVYTLGDERFAPFRINPFAFEIFDDKNRIHIQTHIDFLKSVFNAAFILYAPMPYVLETCLHEIYQDKGWDLTTGQNRRLPPRERGQEHRWPVFPTLTDLYNKIDVVVDRLGYEERITRDVKAGLKARIGSLRLGGKGLMLDTQTGLGMKTLLAQPTVLELERIGSDDEKAFLIGLILTRLYEFRILQGKQATGQIPLQHVTVFEEAHRLLKNTNTDVGTEEANTKAQAVEAFSNMLSEIRAYGQGVLIAEQIPTKLAPDAIKNTNLKLMHRIVAADDREVMGGAMNMEDAQLRIVAALPAGQAVAFAEGADRPYLIKIPEQPEKQNARPPRMRDEDVRVLMQPHCGGEVYSPTPGFARHLGHLTNDEIPQYRDLAREIAESADFAQVFSRYLLSLILEPRQAVEGLRELRALVQRKTSGLPGTVQQPVLILLLLNAVQAALEHRGRHYPWLYNVSSSLFTQLIDPLVAIICQYENKADVIQRLAVEADTALRSFIDGYTDRTKRRPGPLPGCAACHLPCLYHWDVFPFVQDKALEREFVRAIQAPKDDQAMWQQMAKVAKNAAGRACAARSQAHQLGVAVCYTAQVTARLDFSSSTQQKATRSVRVVLEKTP